MGIVVAPDGSAVRTSSSEYAHLRESISAVSRALEDATWNNLSSDNETGKDRPYTDRKDALQRARLYRRRHPLAKQGGLLLQHYVLGKGISLKANNLVKVARIVDEFWEDPANSRVFTSHSAQKEHLDGLWTDGDLFIVMFPDQKVGSLHLGILDAFYVEDVIMDPNNSRIPRWYKVRKPESVYDWATGAYQPRVNDDYTYYRDWQNEESFAPPEKMISPGLVYHVRINPRGKFGQSELDAALDWLKAHKNFMEDRATTHRAAAQIAWKNKRKGGPSEVAAQAARLQSSIVANRARYETNPPPAAGATYVHNEGADMEWMETKISSASDDERELRMMVGSGLGGVPNHYFGDEANANLATATAMELPLLKTYEDWQTLWGDVIKDIIGFLLVTANKAGRLGDRDDSARYSDRVTTPRKVLGQGDVSDDANAGEPSKGGPPKPMAEADPVQQQKSTTLAVTQISKTVPLESIQRADDADGKVDWFVDVDFPEIVHKDLQGAVTAIKALYEMAPPGNIESQKLVVEMVLKLLGENNLDQLMERLFPADAAPDELLNPPGSVNAQDPLALASALKGLIGAAGAAGAIAPTVSAPTPKLIGPGAPVKESADDDLAPVKAIAEYRVRRVLAAARQAVDALAEAESSDAAVVGG